MTIRAYISRDRTVMNGKVYEVGQLIPVDTAAGEQVLGAVVPVDDLDEATLRAAYVGAQGVDVGAIVSKLQAQRDERTRLRAPEATPASSGTPADNRPGNSVNTPAAANRRN